MITGCNIIIKNHDDILYLYRHPDGYPEGAGESLKEFVKGYAKKGSNGPGWRHNVGECAGWLIIHGYKECADHSMDWKVGAYELTTRLHCDVEYIYTIDLSERTLSCRETKNGFRDNATLGSTVACKEFKTVKF